MNDTTDINTTISGLTNAELKMLLDSLKSTPLESDADTKFVEQKADQAKEAAAQAARDNDRRANNRLASFLANGPALLGA